MNDNEDNGEGIWYRSNCQLSQGIEIKATPFNNFQSSVLIYKSDISRKDNIDTLYYDIIKNSTEHYGSINIKITDIDNLIAVLKRVRNSI